VRIWVLDSGAGLQPGEVERVFERGWQANPKAGGKGLGLYISQRIVEAHGGTMWVESTPGHGATFHVSLPVDSRALVSPQDQTSVAP
jgi:signal transduction histidine kinase